MIRTVVVLLFASAVFGFESSESDARYANGRIVGGGDTDINIKKENNQSAESDTRFANGRIVGGGDTDIKFYPFQVSLQLNGSHWCGGSVIDADYILTAAHCMGRPGNYNLRVGTSLNSEGGWEVEIAEIIVHEKYRSYSFDYDVAVVRLVEPLQFSEVVQPVGLAEEGEEYPAGTLSVTIGWGTKQENYVPSRILQEVEIPLLDNAACEKYYPRLITSRMICAGYEKGGHDACLGDSGGALVVSSGKQVGIVSWGRGCARSSSPGVYTRVAALRNWIAQKSFVQGLSSSCFSENSNAPESTSEILSDDECD